LGLRSLGHEVRLVVYGHGAGEDTSGLPIHRAARIPGARKTSAGPFLAKPFCDAALVAALRRVIREHAIDVVDAHNYEGLMAALAAGKRPIVYHAHNTMADELPHFLPCPNAARRFGAWLDRTFPRRADHIVAPHARLAAYLEECGCGRSRITVIPPSVDVTQFPPCEIGSAIPPVLYAGNLDAYQNLGLLERAMDRVRETLPAARWVVATAQTAVYPGAEAVGVQSFEELRCLLSTDAVFACPRTSWSGYPIKLLNAMAAGMPIVACQSSAYPLVHEHSALIVPDDDAEAFADALLRLLRDPPLRSRLGANARGAACANHAPGAVATATESVYRSLLSRD
jgi:glycosyltransferase involved in cell wall biosynthesis